MKRFLKVGEASSKIVWKPGSRHVEITAVAAMRGSFAVRMVPKNEPKLVPVLVKPEMPLARIIVGPFCGPIVDGGHVPIVAGRNGVAIALGRACLHLAASRGVCEC